MAASIHLSKAGLRVLCVEPDVADTSSVGESLDWSAPGLLQVLGLTHGTAYRGEDSDVQAPCHAEVRRRVRPQLYSRASGWASRLSI